MCDWKKKIKIKCKYLQKKQKQYKIQTMDDFEMKQNKNKKIFNLSSYNYRINVSNKFMRNF
jgi:hypothetical protein